MEKIKSHLVLLLFILPTMIWLTSCTQSIKGNGHVISEERNITAFTDLVICGVFNVFIKQGERENVQVETDENLQAVIETVNKKNTLFIRWKDNTSVKKSTKMDVYVTVKDLKSIDISGVGNISTTSAVTSENLELKFSGVGTASLEMNCKKFSADISAVGDIHLKGAVAAANLTVSGAGNLNAFDLSVKKLTVNVSGIGNAEVNAEEEISITSSGMGDVSYTGNAVVTTLHASGIGKVKKV